jgi:hypothetical protein
MKEKRPGPGEYNPKKSGKEVRYTIGLKLTTGKKRATPGPGEYADNRQAHYQKLTGAKIGSAERKPPFQTLSKDHSLSSYNLRVQASDNRGPKHGFGSASRERSHREKSPGPGSY